MVASALAAPISAPIFPGSSANARWKNPCACRQAFRGQPLVHASPALKIQVHRIRMRRAFRSSRLNLYELGFQRIGEPRYDFVLHVEKIGDGFIEALRPKMYTALGVDQLHVHPKPLAATLSRALEHIADGQLPPDLP